MIAVKKETLEDSLTRILWYYLNNDFNLNMVARELLSRESAALALQAGHSVDEFLKSGAYLLKNYIAVSFMPGSVNPLYVDACTGCLLINKNEPRKFNVSGVLLCVFLQ